MRFCTKCGYVMPGEATACEICGAPLEAPEECDETLIIQSSELHTIPKPQRRWRSAELGEDRTVALCCGDRAHEVTLMPDELVILGRKDPESTIAPDVDLSDQDAFERGVSRLHACLTLDKGMLMVKDLGSTNGTFVNGQRVTGEHWRVVRNQDELRLGKLPLKLRFASTD